MYLKINHFLDPMHIIKNVAIRIWDHMIGKQDSLGIREDLQNIGRMPKAWPQERPNGRVLLPHTTWTLIKKEAVEVKQTITSFHIPNGCMRSLKGAFTKNKKRGMEQLCELKSHDWHKMLQVSMNFHHGFFLF